MARTPAKRLASAVTYAAPVIDGHHLPDDPVKLYATGQINPVPTLMGFNGSEGLSLSRRLHRMQGVKGVDEAEKLIKRFIRMSFYRGAPNVEEIARAVMDEYVLPLQNKDEERLMQAAVEVYGDVIMVAPCVHLAQLHSSK